MEMDRLIGRLLDNRYEILEVIGSGGMSVVYKARCHRLNRLVAVKVLKDDFFQDEEFRRRFHAESQAVAMLSHPNIVAVYDVATSDDADYIVMELIDGITLKQYMEKKGVLNWKETLHFAIQIAKALDHAHSKGIVHRDIKPHNVMVLKNGSVKVTDFGIARVMSNSNSLTKEALGSVHYISPEQAKGGYVDNRSDLYSLGVVMYEMMAGRPPYDGESPVAVAIQHINGKAQNPSALNPNIPGGLEQIIMRAMEKDPSKRYPTAASMLYDMDEFRKNPTILFDYNNPETDLDAAAKLSEQARQRQETMPLPKTTAERVAARQEPARPRPQETPRQQPRPYRQREEIIEEESERSSKIATVAIIACVVLAVIAIVVCVIAIGNNAQSNMLDAPNLLGKTEEEASSIYTDFVIKIGDHRESSEYPAGQIMRQTPAAGTPIAKGGTITVVISLGSDAKTAVMADLIKSKEEDAKNYLNGLGMGLNVVLKPERSATIEEGHITRTEPAKNETLTEGQTVYLYYSTGPDIRIEKVPGVKGLSYSIAKNQLNSFGFYNIEVRMVDSVEDYETVIDISVTEGVEIDVNTEIFLYLSNGKGTVDPTEPTEPIIDPDLRSTVITVQVPESLTEGYILSVWQGSTKVEDILITAGTVSRDVELTGKGVMTFDFYMGNQLIHSETVDFTLIPPDDDVEEPVGPTDPTDPTDPTEPEIPVDG